MTLIKPTVAERPLKGGNTNLGSGMQIAAIFVAGVAIVCSVSVRRILPTRFLLDDEHIRDVIFSPLASSETQSFRNTAALYRDLGLGNAPEIASLITVVLFACSIFLAARLSEIARFGILGITVFVLSFIFADVYLAQYSKESMSVVLVLVLLALPRSGLSESVFVGACVAYGALVRPYWIIVAVLYIAWRFLLPHVRNPFLFIALIFGTYALMSLVFQYVLEVDLTAYRSEVNYSRTGVDVSSLITDPLPTAGWWAPVDATVVLATLVFPVPLVLSGGISHLVSAGVVVFLWAIAFRSVVFKAVSVTYEPLEHGAPRSLRAARALALLISMVVVQAVFEPDFGSYVKHLTPLLPLFLTMVPLRKREVA